MVSQMLNVARIEVFSVVGDLFLGEVVELLEIVDLLSKDVLGTFHFLCADVRAELDVHQNGEDTD